jgi:hypothetical protein
MPFNSCNNIYYQNKDKTIFLEVTFSLEKVTILLIKYDKYIP